MRTWSRAERETICGYCRRMIYREQPLFIILPPGLSRGMVRCRECADEPVPTDLPALPINVPKSTPMPAFTMTRFTPNMLPIDFKQKASGE